MTFVERIWNVAHSECYVIVRLDTGQYRVGFDIDANVPIPRYASFVGTKKQCRQYANSNGFVIYENLSHPSP